MAELVKQDFRAQQRQRRLELEDTERRQRAEDTARVTAEREQFEVQLRGMPSGELAAVVEQALVESKPFVVELIGDCRNPFESAALRSAVWAVLHPRESRVASVAAGECQHAE